MTQQTISELLILALCAISSSRIFFIKKVKTDFLAILPLVSFITAILNLLAFGSSITEMVVLAVSGFVFFWNVRALLRFIGHLYVDHYGIMFKIISVISLVLSVLFFIFVLVNQPVKLHPEKLNVTEVYTPYKGSFSKGFQEKTNPFEHTSCKITTFAFTDPVVKRPSIADYIETYKKNESLYKEETARKQAAEEAAREKEEAEHPDAPKPLNLRILKDKEELEKEKAPDLYKKSVDETDKAAAQKKIDDEVLVPHAGTILFVSDKCSNVKDYEPIFIKLAHDGYFVVAAEFYSSENKYFNNINDTFVFRTNSFASRKLKNPEQYEKITENIAEKELKEYNALIKIVNPDAGDKVYILADETANGAVSDILKSNADVLDGVVKLTDIEEYPAGFGAVEQTRPLLAKKFGRKKDRSLYTSSHIATMVEKFIENPKVELIAEPEDQTLE